MTRDEKLPRDENAHGRSRRFGLVNLTKVAAMLEEIRLEHPHNRRERKEKRSEGEQLDAEVDQVQASGKEEAVAAQ